MPKQQGNVTICFLGTKSQKSKVNEWAKEDERSVSYILRKMIDAEARRRETQKTADKIATK